jgi:hypothetical protein
MEIVAPERVAELSALGTVLFAVLLVVWKGIPALIAYMERKDSTHRADIMSLIAAGREERDSFYKNLGIKLDRIHDRLDKIETSVTTNRPQEKK